MELSSSNIIHIALYFGILLVVGILAKKRQTRSDFLIAGRNIGAILSAASILAVLGGVLIVSQTALAYDYGYSAIWFYVGLSLGMILLGLCIKQIKPLADSKKFHNLSDYFYEKYDRKTGVLVSIVLFFAFFFLLAGQFVAGGHLFSPLGGISYELTILLMGIGTLVYLTIGGFKAVIKTDFFQFIIMFFCTANLNTNNSARYFECRKY